jgi:hypothetical protein
MFHKADRISGVRAVALAAALLAYPCSMLAQHGGGRGTSGSASAGPMGAGGRATGVSAGDDLKDFHAALAVQATSQQIIEYDSMRKSTAAASTELQTFLEQMDKEKNASELASRGTTLDQALEKARTENKKFLDGLSDRQKSGLKEITRKLSKADSDLAQQARELDQEVGYVKAVGQRIATSAQGLGHALTSFQSEQLGLGKEMGIEDPDHSQSFTFNLPPVKNSVHFANQPIEITTSGVISKGVAEGGQSTFTLELTADMSDLQQNITEVLRTQLDQANRCGERIGIQTATLTPSAPATVVTAQLHFERWACGTFSGRETTNEMFEGNGTIEVKLTPAVAEDGTLRLVPQIGRIDAAGLVGDLLRSGSLGEVVRDKISDLLLSTVRQGGDFKTILPPAAQGYATLHHAQFLSSGSGKLVVVLDGEIRISNEKAASLTSALKERSSSQETVQETAPR